MLHRGSLNSSFVHLIMTTSQIRHIPARPFHHPTPARTTRVVVMVRTHFAKLA